ncbi:flagellar biosynthesis protein FlgL [Burkholderia mayonis]|uniref:Flagellar biosynthesis protein FlgL n=1 Tax=Burkholderia mayonis TaxID=1385591 RepID=A0A1B4FQR5_9BURK|nr:flagellar biosynthesis protein FlgL [Burkholderia mayonis]AOJ06010.1 flagellar biosynthesis protein FlgL [Burkholderia mayonis]KVE56924.1 flagellar biosynthesis protein FlgL [Burkholderia mayonis]
MRVTSNQYHSIMIGVSQRAQSQIADAMVRMATRQRILRTSDDVIGSVRLALLIQQDGAREQYRDNIGKLTSRLQLAESRMTGLGTGLGDVHDLLLWASDGSKPPQDLPAIAQTLETLRRSLVSTANAKDGEGNYLFSGTAIKTQPIQYDETRPVGSRYTYAGNDKQQEVIVGDGMTEVANDNMKEMADLLNKLEHAIETMNTPGADPNDDAVRAVLVAALDASDATRNAVDAKIARSGNARSTLKLFDDMHQEAQVAGAEAVLDVGQADIAQVYEEYMNYRVALEATQKIYAQVIQMSLFNVL